MRLGVGAFGIEQGDCGCGQGDPAEIGVWCLGCQAERLMVRRGTDCLREEGDGDDVGPTFTTDYYNYRLSISRICCCCSTGSLFT